VNLFQSTKKVSQSDGKVKDLSEFGVKNAIKSITAQKLQAAKSTTNWQPPIK